MPGRLGKLPPRQDSRTLRLARYLDPVTLPPPPDIVDWSGSVPSWPMRLNDAIGDCTCATAANMIAAWTRAAAGTAEQIPDSAVVAAYSAVSGYDPSTGANDRGAVELDVLRLWRLRGIGGHKILAYAAVDVASTWQARVAAWLFGGLYIGVALPRSAQKQHVWAVNDSRLIGDAAPGSWGGHAVSVVSADPEGLTIVTWGELKRVTWAFWAAYVDECWAVLSPDWIERIGQAPSGFDLATLMADLQRITA